MNLRRKNIIKVSYQAPIVWGKAHYLSAFSINSFSNPSRQKKKAENKAMKDKKEVI